MRAHRFVVVLVVVAMTAAVGCSGSGSDQSAERSTRSAPSTTGVESGDVATETASPSPGCTAAAPTTGRSVVTVRSGDRDRTYVRYVPEGLVAGEPAPLVLDFPAYSPAETEETFSGFTKVGPDGVVPADTFGAVVVTPEPVNGAGALVTWNYVGTPGWTDDQRFVTDLLDDVGSAACIDTDRVLATGFAVGAVFASILTCEQDDRIAVLATVSGLYSPEGCDPSTAVPVISFHGTGDRFIPYDGGVGSGPAGLGLTPETTSGLVFMAGRPGALDSSTAWAAHDGCDPEPIEQPTAQPIGDGVTMQAWPGCGDGTDVELYTIDGGEHTWPGSTGMDAYTELLGPVSDEIDATDVIWSFFEAHT